LRLEPGPFPRELRRETERTVILARRLGKEKSVLERRTDLQPAYIRQVVRAGLVNMPPLSRVEMPDTDLDAVIAYLAATKASP